MVSTSAARQAARILAAPAVKLIIAGTRPADITASNVTTAPFEVGSMTPSARPFERERHQLGAEDRGRLQAAACRSAGRSPDPRSPSQFGPWTLAASISASTTVRSVEVVRKIRSDMIS